MKNRDQVISLMLFLVIVIFSMAACSNKQELEETNQPAEIPQITESVPQAPLELEGVTWRLDTYLDSKGNRMSLIPGSEITAEFKDGQVSGESGCNNFFAAYLVDGDRLGISSISFTEMFCVEPSGIMQQEETYLKALNDAASYLVNDRRLQIIDLDGQTRLIFTASN
jgi:heat shock protein HslJ